MKKLINLAYGLLIGIFLLFIILTSGVKLVGLHPYVVTSGSMIPVYPVGCMIYVDEVQPQTIEVGDAITFYLQGGEIMATHEVYEIDSAKELFYTQGVNNLDSNGEIIKDSEPVPFDQMIGKPVFSISYLGAISQVCTTAPGIYIVIGFAVFYCLILMIMERILSKEEK